MSKEVLRLALEALKELVAQTETGLFAVRHDHVAMQDARQAITALREALAEQSAQQEPCGGCYGSGWITRDPDIGTDQECFVCGGSGACPKEPNSRTK